MESSQDTTVNVTNVDNIPLKAEELSPAKQDEEVMDMPDLSRFDEDTGNKDITSDKESPDELAIPEVVPSINETVTLAENVSEGVTVNEEHAQANEPTEQQVLDEENQERTDPPKDKETTNETLPPSEEVGLSTEVVNSASEQGDEIIEQVIVSDQIDEVSAIVDSFDSSNDEKSDTISLKATGESVTSEENIADHSDNIEIITTQEDCHDTEKILAEICEEAVGDESMDTNNDSTNSGETFYITTESSSMDESSKGKEPSMTYYIVNEEVFVNADKNAEIQLNVAAAPTDESNVETTVQTLEGNNTQQDAIEEEIVSEQDNVEEETIDRIRQTVDSNESDGTAKKPEKAKQKPLVKPELKIPNHVLGRNVANPTMEVTRNGRPPKPRIGVKVPHRNLTSQIVSKQDITEVLLERQRAKNANRVYGENTLFAKKLTKTLANRLVPPKQNQLKNADLISILEGTEQEVSRQPSKKKEKAVAQEHSISDNVVVKHLEQQLAIKQLNELQSQRINKRKRQDAKAETSDDNNSDVIEEIFNRRQETRSRRAKEDFIEIEVTEPKFKANVPVKTYGRKWKTTEPTASEDVPPPPASIIESDLNENQTIYITKKSARVVKRKVIWDPDEAPPRITTAKIIKITEKSPTKSETSQSSKSPQRSLPAQTTEKIFIKQIDKPSLKTPVKSPKIMERGLNKEKIAIITKSPNKTDEKQQINLVRVKNFPNTRLSKALTPKKKLTEVDRLLMDEGAVKMLYSVKNEDIPFKKRKESVISLDLAEKELRDKTNEILNDLQTNKESTIMLRKKDATTPPTKKTNVPASVSRQKSKDSTRSSIQSPPASPVFHQHAEASRIIRRHSSDSFSSEAEDEETNESEKDAVTVPERVTRSRTNTEELSKKFNKLIEVEEGKIRVEEKETVTVKYFAGFVNVVLKEFEKKVYLTVEAMTEIGETLSEIEEDETINAVLFTSDGTSFCHGINYKQLIAEKENARRTLAKEMANATKTFLLSLMKHSKILMCGVHGEVVGLGVVILSLFDVILASDTATFVAPYGQLGCIPEGLPFIKQGISLHKAFISELFYESRTLSANEAYRFGLVTKVMKSSKLEEELLTSAKKVSKQSPQFILFTKEILMPDNQDDIEEALNKDTQQLIVTWSSAECQKNFANYS